MKKRILSVAMTLVLCLGLLPLPAAAESEGDGSIVDITDTGLQLTYWTTIEPAEKTVYKAGEGTVTVARTADGETFTLELNNATINTSNEDGLLCDVFCPLDISNAIVTLTGTNSITAAQRGLYLGQGHLKSGTRVSIQGSGSLNVNKAKQGIFIGGSADTNPLSGRTNVEFMSGSVTVTEATEGFYVSDSSVTIGGTAEVIIKDCTDEGFYFHWSSGGVTPDSNLTVKDNGKVTITGSRYGISAIREDMSLNVLGNGNVNINTLNHGLYVNAINISDNAVVSVTASQGGPAVQAHTPAIALNGTQILLPEGGKIDTYSRYYQTVYEADGTTVASEVLFGVPKLSVTVSASPTEGGTVTGDGTYEKGASATVTAAPASGYQFVKWTKDGNEVSKNNPYTFTVTEDTALTAVFERQPAQSLSVSPATLVWAQGKSDTASLTVAPQPAGAAYGTVTWTSDDEEVATVDENGTVTPGTKAGTATITASTLAGEKTLTATCIVTVNEIKELEEFPPELSGDGNNRYKLVMEDGLSEVPEGLKKVENLNTVEAIKTKLTAELTGVPENNKAVYDVELMVSDNSGATWKLATADDFPKSGTLTVTLPYPATTDNTYTFTVVHMFTIDNGEGKKPGDTETPAVTNTADGIQFQVTDLSPISVGWTEPETKPVVPVEPIEPVEPVEPIDPIDPVEPSKPSGGGGGSSTYAVTVHTSEHGQVTSDRRYASRGTTVTLTVTPDEGYILDTLTVTDSRGNEIKLTAKGSNQYTFTMPDGKVTMTARFIKADAEQDHPALAFSDLDSAAWYYEAVDYVLSQGLMSGYGNGLFGPDDNLSRAQLAQILYNHAGRPSIADTDQFTDVTGGWYADAVTWAAANGIVSGYGNGQFGPSDPITREQLVVILYRYAGSPVPPNLALNFTDADTASGYALDPLRWAVEKGIISGCGDGRLDPTGQATRAQTAAMLQRYLKKAQ